MTKSQSADLSISLAIFLSAVFYSYLVLNRWIVTDLGLASYGKLWHFYISYSDFGFFRRGLIGTVFTVTGLNSIFSSEYMFAFAVHHVAIVVLAILVFNFCIRQNLTAPIFLFGIAFSPALIIHSGYTTGSLDVFVLVFALVNILYVRCALIFSLIIVCGVLTHELFIFTIPAQFYALFLWHRQRVVSFSLLKINFIALLAAVPIASVVFFGRVSVAESAFNEVMQNRLTEAFDKSSMWSGFFEVSSSVQTNFDSTSFLLSLAVLKNTPFLILPLLYILFLLIRSVGYTQSVKESVFLCIVILFPLLAFFVATDWYRWISMSANMAILLTLVLASEQGKTSSKLNIPIFLLCFLAPFGAADLSRPFPVHQFLLDKLVVS